MSDALQGRKVFLDTVYGLTNHYSQAPDVWDFARTLDVTVVMGPVAVGKNTVMDASGLHVATSVTSRPHREGDTGYRRYLDFSDPDTRAEVFENLRHGRYVQAASHPATRELYAAEQEDFPVSPCLFDVTAAEYVRLRQAHLFGTLRGVYLAVRDYDEWQRRWCGRDGNDDRPDRQSRMTEGYVSLTTALNHPEVQFIPDGEIDIVAADLRRIAEGHILPPARAEAGREGARLMLKGIIESGDLVLRSGADQ